MKTVQEIFKEKPELLKNFEVKELATEYEDACDALIDIQQTSQMSKEKYLKILVREIQESINMELNRDAEAERFKETERVNFREATVNLKSYISNYLRDFSIYL